MIIVARSKRTLSTLKFVEKGSLKTSSYSIAAQRERGFSIMKGNETFKTWRIEKISKKEMVQNNSTVFETTGVKTLAGCKLADMYRK